MAGKQKYYAIGAKNGYICLLGQDSKQLLFDLKMNGSCNAMAFSPCERYLYTAGDEAEIYQWDLGTRKCVTKVADEGAFQTTAMQVSPSGAVLATGSKMGSVNIFNATGLAGDVVEPKPFKTLMNLTTSVTDLSFNHTSELLCSCSKWKKNAIKLVHIPSYTNFQNFPGVAPGVLKYPLSV